MPDWGRAVMVTQGVGLHNRGEDSKMTRGLEGWALQGGGSVVADRAVYRGTGKGSGGCCDRVAGLYDGVQGQGEGLVVAWWSGNGC